MVREADPLKQGLKLVIRRSTPFRHKSPGSRSIKTRIETIRDRRGRAPLFLVREADPLKQGLKPEYELP